MERTKQLTNARVRPSRGLAVSERKLLLAFGDGVAVAAAFLVAFNLDTAQVRHLGFAVPRVALGITLLAWFVAAYLVDGYRLASIGSLRTTFANVVGAVGVSLVALLGVFFIVPYRITRPTLLLWVPLAIVGVIGWRVLYRRLFATADAFAGNIAVVGTQEAWDRVMSDAGTIMARLYRVVDVIDPESLTATSRIESLVAEGRVDQIVLGMRDNVSRELFSCLVSAYDNGVPARSLADLYEEMSGRMLLDQIGHSWLLSLPMRSETSRIFITFKRGLDMTAGLAGFVLLALLLPLAWIAMRFDGGGSVLFRQVRVGKYGEPFEILKLRTMRPERRALERQTSIADARITRAGRVLRRLHLDELPQSWNIIRGDMSVIGPRPEQPEYVERLQQKIDFYNTRLSVRPGLTGWAQVNYGYGEGEEGARMKLSYDLYYIKRQSMSLDLLILSRTLFAVFSLKGR